MASNLLQLAKIFLFQVQAAISGPFFQLDMLACLPFKICLLSYNFMIVHPNRNESQLAEQRNGKILESKVI